MLELNMVAATKVPSFLRIQQLLQAKQWPLFQPRMRCFRVRISKVVQDQLSKICRDLSHLHLEEEDLIVEDLEEQLLILINFSIFMQEEVEEDFHHREHQLLIGTYM